MTTLNTIKSVDDITAAETKFLIEFYNEFNQDKPVKKFADRATAVKRCTALLLELVEEGQVELEKPKSTGKQPKVEKPESFEPSQEELAGQDEESEETPEEEVKLWPFAQQLAANAEEQSGATGKKPAAPAAKRPLSRASNAAGISASWTDPEVASARLTRNGVTVTVKGKTTEHKSTRDAFRHYRLMDSKHIRFRGTLKAEKAAVYTENGTDYHFAIV